MSLEREREREERKKERKSMITMVSCRLNQKRICGGSRVFVFSNKKLNFPLVYCYKKSYYVLFGQVKA